MVSYNTFPSVFIAFTFKLAGPTEKYIKPCAEASKRLSGIPAVTAVSSEPAPEINWWVKPSGLIC
ncbi:hypothetical protein [uncultured Mucilaginibacter sp.]|uniref:hypothetical protein n=1 Tax=uncultured Mucilaginibacter sp. TaxID=797541 RepID=UPI0025D44220|nr:hypothetical protein [uncultured Mucilaginibacter sp.]